MAVFLIILPPIIFKDFVYRPILYHEGIKWWIIRYDNALLILILYGSMDLFFKHMLISLLVLVHNELSILTNKDQYALSWHTSFFQVILIGYLKEKSNEKSKENNLSSKPRKVGQTQQRTLYNQTVIRRTQILSEISKQSNSWISFSSFGGS